MKYFLLTLALLLATVSHSQSLKALKWLEGTWERQNTKPGSNGFEIWEAPTKEAIVGKGLTIKGADTVFVEKLRIVSKDKKLYYVADVSQNAAPVYFELTEVTQTGFTCENPEHDFPKKIVYVLDGTKLTATISGNGKEIPYRFIRKE